MIAINKPHGLLVHRSRIAPDAHEFALQRLRDQIGRWVYPVHRLDRKTSGVLLFAKSEEVNRDIQELFKSRCVSKSYVAIVRGFTETSGLIDYPLRHGDKVQEAQTRYERIQTYEIDLPSGGFQTSRYSLVHLHPLSGRFHQLRKHMAHIHHPIIGDRPHGCNKQNRLWKAKFDMITMLLHAESLQFEYPKGNSIFMEAELSPEFRRVLDILNSMNRLASADAG